MEDFAGFLPPQKSGNAENFALHAASQRQLEYDRKGFLAFHRNRNAAARLSALSAVTETFGCKKIAAERGYFGRKKLFRPQKIVIFWAKIPPFSEGLWKKVEF